MFCGENCIRWGTSNGGVRLRCLVCFKTFSLRKVTKIERNFKLFKTWASSGATVKIVNNSSQSSRTLLDSFHDFLDDLPSIKKLDIPKEINLKCDGKYFGRCGCSLVFKEGKNIIFWHYVVSETYRDYLYCFFRIKELGYIVKSVTSDKHGSIIGAVATAFPHTPHQYCTVHLQRRCQTLLTKHPETQAGRDLLELVRFTNKITSENEKEIYLKWLENYEERNKKILSQRTYRKDGNINSKDPRKIWWYTHKNLRLAFNTLKSSRNNMFFYLQDINIPKDTNGLEAEFTHLKTKFNMHRGLSKERRAKFVYWYWFLKSVYNNTH